MALCCGAGLREAPGGGRCLGAGATAPTALRGCGFGGSRLLRGCGRRHKWSSWTGSCALTSAGLFVAVGLSCAAHVAPLPGVRCRLAPASALPSLPLRWDPRGPLHCGPVPLPRPSLLRGPVAPGTCAPSSQASPLEWPSHCPHPGCFPGPVLAGAGGHHHRLGGREDDRWACSGGHQFIPVCWARSASAALLGSALPLRCPAEPGAGAR